MPPIPSQSSAADDWFYQFNPDPSLPSADNTGVTGGMLGDVSPAPTASAPAAAPQAVPNQTWDQNSFASQFGSPGTPDELVAKEQQLNAAGIKVLRNASGVAGKIQLPNGQIVDVINSAGIGGKGFQWLAGDAPGGTQGLGGAGGVGGGALSALGYGFGSSMAPWTQNFSAPTADQALNSPGMQFALSENNRMLQNGAAAKGTLLNGRFQQALGAANIGAGLQGYGDVYNRSLNEYLLGRENFDRNQDRPFSKSLSLAQLGKPNA